MIASIMRVGRASYDQLLYRLVVYHYCYFVVVGSRVLIVHIRHFLVVIDFISKPGSTVRPCLVRNKTCQVRATPAVIDSGALQTAHVMIFTFVV
jgi:hypothetical protein